MKKFIFILCVGLSFYARLDACSDCVKTLCDIMREYRFRAADGGIKQTKELNYPELFTYDAGLIQGLRCAIINIERKHPDCKLSLEDFEMIMNKKFDE